MPHVRQAPNPGVQSPMGCTAVRKTLAFSSTARYAELEIEGDVVSDNLAPQAIIKPVCRDRLTKPDLERFKPLTAGLDTLHINATPPLAAET